MKNTLYEINERRNSILSLINEQGDVTVETLSQILGVTNVTIRRDLDFLASSQKITRVFGGAKKLLPTHAAIELKTKPEIRNANIESADPILQKKSLACAASDLLVADDVVLINSSTTASYVVEYLDNKTITVISNNINILSRKMNPNTILLMTGGQVLPGRDSLSGTYALETLKKNRSTKCIIGVSGISIKGGLTSPVLEESIINKIMVSQTAGMVIAIASSDKIGLDASFHVCDVSKIDILVTDDGITEDYKKEFEKIGIKVIIANAHNTLL